MTGFQVWLEQTLASVTPVATFMRTAWGWPTIDSVHFIGLTLLFGTIAVWDLLAPKLGPDRLWQVRVWEDDRLWVDYRGA